MCLLIYGILGIIGLIVFLIVKRDEFYYNDDVFFAAFIGIIVICLMTVVLWLATIGLANATDPVLESTKTDRVEIIALKDSVGTESSFYLGTGYIDDEMHYVYMTETDKGMSMEKIKAEDVFLKYVEGDTPHIDTIHYNYTNSFLDWFLPGDAKQETYIYIPEGSLTTEYVIDLE